MTKKTEEESGAKIGQDFLKKVSSHGIGAISSRKVPILNTTDYSSWKIRMTAYLKSMKVWGVVSGDLPCPSPEYREEFDAWTDLDCNAISVIQEST